MLSRCCRLTAICANASYNFVSLRYYFRRRLCLGIFYKFIQNGLIFNRHVQSQWEIVAIAGLKMSRFQGPPLPMAFIMDSARIKIITSRAIYTTVSYQLGYQAYIWPYPLVHVVFLVQLTLYSTTVYSAQYSTLSLLTFRPSGLLHRNRGFFLYWFL